MNVSMVVEEEYAIAAGILGKRPPPLVFDRTLRNASSNGVRVGVNDEWMREALRACDNEADRRFAVRAIMAHELGHHFDPNRSPDRLVRERFADSVAGLVLGRTGGLVEPLLAVLASMPVSPNHPPLPVRRVSLELGRAYALGGWDAALARIA